MSDERLYWVLAVCAAFLLGHFNGERIGRR